MAKSKSTSSRPKTKSQRSAKSKPAASRKASSDAPKAVTRKPRNASTPKSGKNAPSAQELQLTHELLNRVSSAVMVVDMDFIVTYVNEGTKKLFARHVDSFRKLWPNFDPSAIIGTCIDGFHKVPAHQRRLLGDPRNLPFTTDITVGDAKIQLHVTPVMSSTGKPSGFALEWSDVTLLRETAGQVAAIGKAQGVISFSLDGIILSVNDNFLNATGYRQEELIGKHHSMLVDPEYAASTEYRQFWEHLKQGQYKAAQFKRVGKNGREVWIQASYNAILDLNGVPFKVVKYATDITQAKKLEFEIAEQQMRTEREERERNERDRQFAEEQQQKVHEVLRVCNSLATGDLTVDVPDLGSDSIGQVAKALGSAIESIRETLSEVNRVTVTVETAASELNDASDAISRGAQHQASSIEETASRVEEITSTVKLNTDNAQQARQFAVGASDVANKGGSVVADAIKGMADINQSSTRIADIITTIDEIAFQTNLLALNAAVEAARAGEQGRGFAVVASEVRNLAQRSASAAKEIKSLIQDSVRKVETGTSLVNQSGKTLEEIVSSVRRVADIVAEIAAASKEQLSGIEQVNKAVTQMDRVTQSNASQTEEMSATAAGLLQHAQQLREVVQRFQLGGASDSAGNADNRNSGRSNRTPKRESVDEILSKVAPAPARKPAGAGFMEF
ncbi:MAG: methyl-accepting chemotaxis protein [Planctomycetaceae bacterium]